MAENSQRDARRAAYGHRIFSALTVGNIVTVALQIFREKSDDYLTTSLQSYLWLFLTFLGAGVLGGVGYVLGQSLGLEDWTNILIIVSIFALPLLAYGRARKTATGGVLSRLIFNKLVSHSETKEEVQNRIFSKTWVYLRAEIFFWLILSGLYFGFAFILGLILRVLFSSLRDLDVMEFFAQAEQDFSSIFLPLITVIVLVLLFYLGIILFFSYFVVRLWLFDVVIALENVTAVQSIRRSWQLTQNQGRESLLVVLTCGLLLTPPLILSTILSIFGLFGALFIFIASFPLYQAVKAVIYYDLRSRNEGLTFDLEFVAINPTHHLRRVILQTPESIELDLALGGIGSRALAWAIDQLLIWAGIFLFWYFGAVFYLTILLPILTNSFTNFDSSNLNQWVEAIASLLTFALSNIYFIAFETLWRGQTPGKRVAKIRVVQDTGQPVGIKESSLRSLLSIVDIFFFFVGVLLIGITQSEKRLGDVVAGTLVIQDQQGGQSARSSFDFSASAEKIAESLTANTNLKTITPDQFLILRDFLGYRSQLAAGMRSQITTKLAHQIRQLIGQNDQSITFEIDDLDLVEATYLACRQTNQA